MFRRRSKLHETEGRVQFEVFEKLTSVCFFQIARETIPLLINNMHETIMQTSHLAIKKFEKLKFIKLRNLHCISFYLHCISFLGTVFRKNCTAPRQSELIEKYFYVYYSNSHNVYQTYEIDECCSLNLQKSSFNFTRELDIRIPGGYNLKRFCQIMNLICRAVTTGGFGGATLKLRFPERKDIFHPWLSVSSIQFYIITLRIQALSLVENQDLLEDRRTELRHN